MKLGVNGRFLAAHVTGVQRFARELLTRVADEVEVVLFVPFDAPVPPGFEGRLVRGRARGHAWEQLELPAAAAAERCDVVLHPANTAPWRAHRSVVVVHDPMFPLSNPEWFTRRYALWQRYAIARALRRATALLTVSEWSRAQLVRHLGVPADRVGVVPQGIAPFDAPAPAREVQRVRSAYGLADTYVIAFGGRDPRKHIRFVMPVADELARRRPDVQVVVVGDAHPRVHPRDEQVAERANVRILGQLDAREAHPLLTGAAALLFPSLAEGFGRPPLESLACGTPALVGSYDAAREVLGDAGHILPWDPSIWADTIEAVLDDPGARRTALAQAQPLLARYSWERCAEVVLTACDRVAHGAPAAREPAEALARRPA